MDGPSDLSASPPAKYPVLLITLADSSAAALIRSAFVTIWANYGHLSHATFSI